MAKSKMIYSQLRTNIQHRERRRVIAGLKAKASDFLSTPAGSWHDACLVLRVIRIIGKMFSNYSVHMEFTHRVHMERIPWGILIWSSRHGLFVFPIKASTSPTPSVSEIDWGSLNDLDGQMTSARNEKFQTKVYKKQKRRESGWYNVYQTKRIPSGARSFNKLDKISKTFLAYFWS